MTGVNTFTLRKVVRIKRMHPRLYPITIIALFVFVFLAYAYAREQQRSISSESLAVYALHAEIAPFFALPGTNTKELKNAALSLENSSREALMSFNSDERRVLRSALYPMTFLRSLPGTESARRRLIADPTLENARIYHLYLKNTMRAYIEDTKHLQEALMPLEEQTLAFWDGETTVKFAIKELERTIETASVLQQKEEERYTCLVNGNTYPPCAPPQYPNMENERKSTTAFVTSLDSDTREHYDIVDSNYWPGSTRPSYSHFGGRSDTVPAVAVFSSTCAPFFEPAVYKTWWSESRMSGIPAVWTTFINDLFFHETKSISSHYFQNISEEGIPYKYQPLNLYLCANSGFDIGKVLTTLYFWSELKKEKLFEGKEDAFPYAASLENALTSSDSVMDARIPEMLTQAILDILSAAAANNDPLFSERDIRRMREFVLIWKTKSAFFEHVLGSIDDMNLSTKEVRNIQEMPLHAVLLSRSYASVLFLHANESVHITPPTLLESALESTNLLEDSLDLFHLRHYRGDLSLLFSPQEMATEMNRADRLINSVFHPQLAR